VTRKRHNHIEDLRGASRLAIDATTRVVDLVEAMQQGIGGGPYLLGRPLQRPIRLLSGPIYRSIRGVTRLVGSSIDLALGQLAPLLGESTPRAERDTVVSVLNGVLGDYLEATGNPLAVEMGLLHRGNRLALERRALREAFPRAGGKLLVLVHGSCLSDRSWTRLGNDSGAALARDLGFTPLHLRYNSGRHISTNGRALAGLLDHLVAGWPSAVEELVIVGHSMGGLVARSACHSGEAASHSWRRRLRSLVCLGSPHHGAPLEQGGHWIDLLLEVSRYSAPLARLGKLRSAGVTDLRFGNVLEEHWTGHDRFSVIGDVRRELKLPAGVQCYAVAATRTPREAGGDYASDGLVPVASALGRHARPELTLGFPEQHQWIGFGMGHLDLLGRPEVYARLRGWLSPACP
jgi:pimeloyl-ACP methyl ester carboxylesterase